MAEDPRKGYYLHRALQAVFDGIREVYSLSPARITELAADAAVQADRERMAEQLRNRVLLNNPGVQGLTPEVAMKLDEVMLDLADQIRRGMTFGQFDNDQTPSDG